jgi:hypothetical protein
MKFAIFQSVRNTLKLMCLTVGLAPACALAAGAPEGFRWAPGAANALALSPLEIEQPPGRLQPWPSALLLYSGEKSSAPHDAKTAAQSPPYWVTAGMGMARLGIDDHPLANAWRVEATPSGARLIHVPMADVKAPPVRVVQHSELLPMTCASGFTDDCTSVDGVLRIHTTFEGKKRERKVGGGFYGAEGTIQQEVYTGTRTLTITHQPSGRSLQLTERLNDSPAYTAPQTAIRYLPGLRRVLLLGVVRDRGIPLGHSVVLPEATAQSPTAQQ